MGLHSLMGYIGLMDKAALLLVEELRQAAEDGKAIDMHAIIGDMTLSVIGQAAFGYAAFPLTQCAPPADDASDAVQSSSHLPRSDDDQLLPSLRSIGTSVQGGSAHTGG